MVEWREAGNLYVNRGITRCHVRRQPALQVIDARLSAQYEKAWPPPCWGWEDRA